MKLGVKCGKKEKRRKRNRQKEENGRYRNVQMNFVILKKTNDSRTNKSFVLC